MSAEEWDAQPWWYTDELMDLLAAEGIVKKPEAAGGSDVADLPVKVRTITRKRG